MKNLPKATNCYHFELKQLFTVFTEFHWFWEQNKTENSNTTTSMCTSFQTL